MFVLVGLCVCARRLFILDHFLKFKLTDRSRAEHCQAQYLTVSNVYKIAYK